VWCAGSERGEDGGFFVLVHPPDAPVEIAAPPITFG
jgi:hypothetical protein